MAFRFFLCYTVLVQGLIVSTRDTAHLGVVHLIEGVVVEVAGDDPSLHIPPDGDAGFAFFRGAFFAVVFEFAVAADGDDGVFF